MRSKIRAMVVDDSVVIRRLVCDVLAGDPDIEVVGTAVNGKNALDKIPALKPDILTLDALERGASDYVTKPANVGSLSESMEAVRSQLIPKIKSLTGRAPVARAARPAFGGAPVGRPGSSREVGGADARGPVGPLKARSPWGRVTAGRKGAPAKRTT